MCPLSQPKGHAIPQKGGCKDRQAATAKPASAPPPDESVAYIPVSAEPAVEAAGGSASATHEDPNPMPNFDVDLAAARAARAENRPRSVPVLEALPLPPLLPRQHNPPTRL